MALYRKPTLGLRLGETQADEEFTKRLKPGEMPSPIVEDRSIPPPMDAQNKVGGAAVQGAQINNKDFMSDMGTAGQGSDFFGKIKKFFLGGDQPDSPEYDPQGIRMPRAPQQTGFEKFLNIALPIGFGVASGVGAFPGAIAGVQNLRNRSEKMYEFDTKRYDAQKNAEAMQSYRDALAGNAQQKTGIDAANQKSLEQSRKDESALGWAKIGVEKQKINKELTAKRSEKESIGLVSRRLDWEEKGRQGPPPPVPTEQDLSVFRQSKEYRQRMARLKNKTAQPTQ